MESAGLPPVAPEADAAIDVPLVIDESWHELAALQLPMWPDIQTDSNRLTFCHHVTCHKQLQAKYVTCGYNLHDQNISTSETSQHLFELCSLAQHVLAAFFVARQAESETAQGDRA